MAYTKTASLQPKPQKRLKNSGAVVGRDRLLWRRAGKILALHRGKSSEPLVHIEPDPNWVGMYRVRSSNGLSDVANLSRAKDAALAFALRGLNYKPQERPAEGTYVRQRRSALGGGPPPDFHRIPELPNAVSLRSGQ